MLTSENQITLAKLNREVTISLFKEKIFNFYSLCSIITATLFYFIYGWMAFVVSFVMILFRFVSNKEITNTEKNYIKLFTDNGFTQADISVVLDNNKVSTIKVWLDKEKPRMNVYILRYRFR